MSIQKVLIIQVKGAHNTETIRNNTYFVGITEMTVNIELFDLVIGRCMSRHRAISCLIRVIV